jgi:Raf kinase inhibitor-like YbhB/YbcL family protein
MLVELSSSAFAAGQPIPRRYSCAGEDLSPPLAWRAVPADAVSLALIVDDPDAPGRTFTHWLAWGINPDAGGLGEGERARREGLMTSGRPATAGRVRRVAMDRTDTSFASTRSRPSRGVPGRKPQGARARTQGQHPRRRRACRHLSAVRAPTSRRSPASRACARVHNRNHVPRLERLLLADAGTSAARAVTPSSARRPPSEPPRRRTGPARARPLDRQRRSRRPRWCR